MPFAAKTGELTDVPVILDAGVLAVTTPDDDYVELVSAKADIVGNRKSFDSGYGPDFSTTLAAGNYLIISLDQETPITIVGGGAARSRSCRRASRSRSSAQERKGRPSGETKKGGAGRAASYFSVRRWLKP